MGPIRFGMNRSLQEEIRLLALVCLALEGTQMTIDTTREPYRKKSPLARERPWAKPSEKAASLGQCETAAVWEGFQLIRKVSRVTT